MKVQAFIKGTYAGVNTKEVSVGGLMLSETAYTTNITSDWHYHENPYFALILQGGSTECRKNGSMECLPGHAYFYQPDYIHRNKGYQPASRNFNVEFDKAFLPEMGLQPDRVNGLLYKPDPRLKLLLVQLFREYKHHQATAPMAIQALSVELVTSITKDYCTINPPIWMQRILEILNDHWAENISLKELSAIIDVHPVTIARYFPKYAHCSLGAYIRKIRVEKSLSLIRATNLTLTEIAYQCGFADQSHFIRTFKHHTHFLPNDFRRA
jgi:AraC family transcriptional regulator